MATIATDYINKAELIVWLDHQIFECKRRLGMNPCMKIGIALEIEAYEYTKHHLHEVTPVELPCNEPSKTTFEPICNQISYEDNGEDYQ